MGTGKVRLSVIIPFSLIRHGTDSEQGGHLANALFAT
jgi:hypothetical protein